MLAHEGPAFPILVDHTFNQNKISVWADPDTGNGTFFIYPEGPGISTFTYEIKAHLKNKTSHMLVTKGSNTNLSLPFDQDATWNITLNVYNKDSKVLLTSKTLELEVTPPGPTQTEFVIYLIPFLIIGMFWLKISLVKRKKGQ